MNKYVADTMAIVLFLEKRKLPLVVKDIFNDAVQGKSAIYISVVSLMEVGYLCEKQRIDATISSVVKFTEENKNFVIYNLDPTIVSEAFKINTIPELHDRLITATAAILNAELLTNDPLIIRSQYVTTIW